MHMFQNIYVIHFISISFFSPINLHQVTHHYAKMSYISSRNRNKHQKSKSEATDKKKESSRTEEETEQMIRIT